MTNGLGIKVMVHDPRTHPRTTEQGVAVRPGTDAYIHMEKHVVTNLQPPYSEVECVSETAQENYRYKSGAVAFYSYEGCMLDCMVEYVTRSCNCSFLEAAAVTCTMQHVYFCMSERLRTYYTQCDCLYPCKQFIYDTQLSALDLPTPLVREVALMENFTWTTEADIKRNMIHLSVFYDSMQYTQTTQVPSYTLDELVANLGGQLGLFLGASALTMLELLECLCTTCFSLRRVKHE